MTKFYVGQECTIGNKEFNDGTVHPARVICIDAVTRDNLPLVVLKLDSDGFGQARSFDDEGLCPLAAARGENESYYRESNLYPVEESKQRARKV